MKNLTIILLATIVIFTIACQKQVEVEYTLISGKIQNSSNSEFQVFRAGQLEGLVKIADDGTFSDTLKMEGDIYLVLDKVPTRIYALNGAELIITADAYDFANSVQVTGKRAGMSNYVIAKSKHEVANLKNQSHFFTLDETEFMTGAKQKREYLEAELAKVTDISESLRSLEQRSIKSMYVSSLGRYPSYHPHFAKKKDYKPSEELQTAMADFVKDDGELYEYSDAYKHLLRSDNYNKSTALVKAKEANSMEMGKLLVAKDIENEIIREDLLFEAVKSSFASSKNKEELYVKYMELAKDNKNRTTITEKYEQISKLDKGNPSPKFMDYENYAGGTSSLDDFKGKYVYIDVWATWCNPCKIEIPYLKTIEEKYHGKNIVFVSISVDRKRTKKAWKQMITDEKMGGVQLIANSTQFMDDYAISGIPRFILIDPEGNIVSKNAPRPSDKKLISLFIMLNI